MLAYMSQLANPDIRRKFGARLKELRKERRLTQKEVAAQIGLMTTHLNKYESGIHAPPIEKIIELSELFGVTIDYLLTGKVDEQHKIKNNRLFERFQALEGFGREDQETIVRVIDAMIAKNHVEKALQTVPL